MIELYRGFHELRDTLTSAAYWPHRSPRGFRQYLDLTQHADLDRLKGLYEPIGLRFVQEWAKRHHGGQGLAFLDVGTWRGDYTLEALAAGLPGSKIMAIEPNHASRLIMEESLAVNGWAIREVSARPLWITADVKLAFQGPMNLREATAEDTKRTEPTRTLDHYATHLSPDCPCILKMDIEGGEIRALQGGARFLTALPAGSWVMLEMHVPPISAVECAAILTGHGFRRWQINRAGEAVREVREPVQEQTQLTFWTR